MFAPFRLILVKTNLARKLKMRERGVKDFHEGKETKVKSRLNQVEAAAAASRFRSIEQFTQQARAIDVLTLGRTRALKLLLKVLQKDIRTRLNEGVLFDQVQLVDYRSGNLTSGLLPRDDCMHKARDTNTDLIEVGTSPDRFSICMLAHYRALMLSDIEAHLYKEQQKAENVYLKSRKILPVRTDITPAEMHQKSFQVAAFLIGGYSVQLQIIHIPPAWRVPLHDPNLRANEDEGLAVQPVSKVFRGHRPLKDPLSGAVYDEMESLEEEIRALLEEDLKNHPKNTKAQTLNVGTAVKSSYLGKPLYLMDYSLSSSSVKLKKKRAKK